jgi:ATP-dependent Clp protease adaptor protein ClpS
MNWEAAMPETEPDPHSTATVAPAKPRRREKGKDKAKPKPRKQPPGLLPQWKVLLHNDDKNEIGFVVLTIMELTPLREQEAVTRTLEAHRTGVALLLCTHKERAELYRDQFASKNLTVTIEPAK